MAHAQQPRAPDYYGGPQQPPYPPANPPGPAYNNGGGAPPQYDKQSFNQVFRIEQPKWNDVWAGILVCHRDRGRPLKP